MHLICEVAVAVGVIVDVDVALPVADAVVVAETNALLEGVAETLTAAVAVI